ncbi:cell division protein FtsK [Candidatus Peregrinibacteria bacterium]|nr:MAG: cell division protein FtsK [Candidatus Peregrinibacteria bacterium]
MAIQSQRPRRKKKSRKKQMSQKAVPFQFHLQKESLAILLFTLVFFLFLILLGQAGPLGMKIDMMLSLLFGIGKWVIPFLAGGIAISLFSEKNPDFHTARIIGIFLFIFAFLGIIHTSSPYVDMEQNVEMYGGWVGFTSSVLLRMAFSTPTNDLAAYVILLGVFFSSIFMMFDITFEDIKYFFAEPQEGDLDRPMLSKKQSRKSDDTDGIQDAEFTIVKPEEIDSPKKQLAKRVPLETLAIRKPAPKKKSDITMTNVEVSGDWSFPSLDLLDDAKIDNYPDDKILHEKAKHIKDKLAQFGVQVDLVDARVGPTVTQFTVSPHEGVPVKKISNLKEDLALALAAKSIRIEAPIPGQPYVGIEIPNEKRSMVNMRDILESEAFAEIESSMRLVVGKDVSGNAFVADLAKMPHLLIAGATGSGKSVGMNSFLISLIYQNSPSDLKFILVDPKRVELEAYNGIPHLLTPVITESDKALAALKWSVNEMMRRYQELQEKKYRNIQEYNDGEKKKMPKIVIVIDELADLMMREYRKDTEAAICRLAQMARAVGMHLIIATQRPSVDVITGVIKANIPTRISFSVTSSIDSRTVLDATGAEDLLGQGDMLFINASLPKPVRIQGIFISSKEIERVTNFIKLSTPKATVVEDDNLGFGESGEPDNADGIGIDLEAIAAAANEDELIPEAINVIRNSGKASATLLQRTLSVGYARAAKILDILEKKGLIGPANGAKAREIFVDRMGE